jgi:hypothetical protein
MYTPEDDNNDIDWAIDYREDNYIEETEEKEIETTKSGCLPLLIFIPCLYLLFN